MRVVVEGNQLAREGRKVLMLNASNDEVIPRCCTDRLWESFGRPPIVWYDCGHYTAVLHMLDALRRRNIAVPDDLAVTGFDGIPFAAISNPGLTTVIQPAELLGEVRVVKEDPDDDVLFATALAAGAPARAEDAFARSA